MSHIDDYEECKKYLTELSNKNMGKITVGELCNLFEMAYTHMNLLRKEKEEASQEMETYDNGGNLIELDELLPCPFCGGEPEIIFIGNNQTKSRSVKIKCPDCRIERTDAGIRFNHQRIAEIAVKNWNRRI